MHATVGRPSLLARPVLAARRPSALGAVAALMAAALVGWLSPLAGAAPAPAPSLSFGLLPIIDALPFYVAEERGYFAAAGVDVRLTTFRSAVERDAALSAGAIDGFLGDLMAAASLKNAGVDVRIFSISLGMTPKEGRIAILSAPGSGITRPQQLRGVPVAISRNSMIEYVAERLLAASGLAPDDIRWTTIPRIPDRFTALMSGKVKAAGLPDPYATLAAIRGATLVIDDASGENLSQSVLLLRADRVAPRREAVRRMLEAYRRAVADVNRDPNAFRPLMVRRGLLPEELEDVFDVTPFPMPALPPRQPVERLLAWMQGRGLIRAGIDYDSLVTAEFVEAPKP